MSGGLDDIREAMRGPDACVVKQCGRSPAESRLIWGAPYPVCAEHARSIRRET